uniref:Putative muscle myosin heavy chain n=1 Tax=Amblyomma aureolatum TaxID=187763 RepID=A0A1E1XAY5_9ACAR
MMAVSSLQEPSMPVGTEVNDDLMSDFVVLPANDESIGFGHVAGNGPLEHLKLSLPQDDGTSLSTCSDDLTHQEAEERIAKVLEENAILKEKVAKSTAKIRQQFEAFTTWQKQLDKAQNALKAELAMAHLMLDEKHSAETELRKQVQELATERQALLEANKVVAQERDEATKQAEAVQAVSNTFEDSVSFCDPVPGLLPNKDKADMSLSQTMVKLHDEQSKTAQLTEKIEQLTEQLGAASREEEALRVMVATLKQKLHEAESRNAVITSQTTSKHAELETALLEKEALVRALQGQCEGKVAEVEDLRRALLTAEKNCDRARRDYAELLRTWQEFENSNDAGERTFVRVERQSGVAASRLAEKHTQELAERDGQIAALKKDVEKLQKELELLPPLQAQVEVYRTDYETERNLRRQLEGTVQEQLNTIEGLNLQITALQDAPPVQRSTQNSSSNGGSRQRASDSAPASAQENSNQGMESLLPCPLCMQACTSRSLYIAHVQSCADGQEVG